MSDMFFNRGLDDMYDWETGSFVWILATLDYVPDRDHDFIDDITNEATVSGYARLVPANPQRNVDNTNDRITYSCDNPDFGDLDMATPQEARWLILARDVTNDADSPLILALDFGDQGVVMGDNFIVYLHPDGFAVDRQIPA
jgi:hypothetical protein